MPSTNATAIDPIIMPTTNGVEIPFFDVEFLVMTDVLLLLPVVMGVVTVVVLLLFVLSEAVGAFVVLVSSAGASVEGVGTGTDVVDTGEGTFVSGASVLTGDVVVVITGMDMDMDKLIIMDNDADVNCSSRRVSYSFCSNRVSIND